MVEQENWLAFSGQKCVAAGARDEVVRAVKKVVEANCEAQILIFDETSGRQVDVDMSKRVEAPNMPDVRGRGRPKLGVVAREVTLLPRHWEWLSGQRGGASAAIRRLVDQARTQNAGADRKRQAQAATDRIMAGVAGDLPHYEEAARALYAGDEARFAAQIADWPEDVRQQVARLAVPAFE